jgi:hypothetical protein
MALFNYLAGTKLGAGAKLGMGAKLFFGGSVLAALAVPLAATVSRLQPSAIEQLDDTSAAPISVGEAMRQFTFVSQPHAVDTSGQLDDSSTPPTVGDAGEVMRRLSF